MQFREEIWAFNRNFSQTPSIDTPLVKWNQQNSIENFANFNLFFLGTRPKQTTANLYPPIFVQPNLGSKGRIWFWFKVGSKSGGIKEINQIWRD